MQTAIGNVWQTDTVLRAIDEAAQCEAIIRAHEFRQFAQVMGPRVASSESPIEAVVWIFWNMLVPHYRDLADEIELVPQLEVVACGSNYRLDFAVLPQRIAVEVDGHDFHERTREQVERRNGRDRDLQTAGWCVMHFAGSEVFKCAFDVVRQVLDLTRTRPVLAKKEDGRG